jgi:PIN domain nuclease of toxin-antitoxin system
LLLDTCACLWLTHGDTLAGPAREALAASPERRGPISVSAITAWEVATLVRKGRYRLRVTPKVWFDRLLTLPGIRLAPLAPSVLIDAADLPGDPPSDLADRMICATARASGLRIVTRDRKILAYGASGFVAILPC